MKRLLSAAHYTAERPESTLMNTRLSLLIAFFPGTLAHGHLTVPTPRPSNWAASRDQGALTSAAAVYRWDQPTHTLDGPMTHEMRRRDAHLLCVDGLQRSRGVLAPAT